ncbi:MAG: phosphate ABC transporter substrate-binding protein PstS [Deltaproteobacteria bacterium]|nr:phosphate ABC transporter substrate-binding protein PstS [Deltaproteobacteria bacterium]
MLNMKKILSRLAATRVILLILAASSGLGVRAFAGGLINGAGATFPYPLYSRWAFEYAKTTGVKLNYQSIGSGGGIKQVQSKTVDFGASDAPLTAKELEEAGLMQFPAAIGGVAPVVNIAGVKPGGLLLTPEALADIYLGVITRWNDKMITELNPGIKLPDGPITVVHRSDGSGTTWVFANYLDKASVAWHVQVGFGTAVNWPVGVGGKGNEGVATYVKRIDNAIGYVEYAYALQNKLTHARLKNRAGAFVEPAMESFTAAAAGADWRNTPGFAVVLTDQKGKEAWPISGATFILVPKNPSNCENTKKVLEFFDWSFRNGAEMAKALDYVPVPPDVYNLMEKSWAAEIKCSGTPLWKK